LATFTGTRSESLPELMFQPFAAAHTGIAHGRCTRARPARLLQPATATTTLAGNAAEVPQVELIADDTLKTLRSIDDNETPSNGREDCTISTAALEAGYAKIFVAERAATMPSAGILLAIRRRSFARAASIYISQARAAPAARNALVKATEDHNELVLYPEMEVH
jgi:hypothetical protein